MINMRLNKTLLTFAMAALAALPNLMADTVNTIGTFAPVVANNAGNTFYNNASLDNGNAQCNIGFLLTGATSPTSPNCLFTVPGNTLAGLTSPSWNALTAAGGLAPGWTLTTDTPSFGTSTAFQVEITANAALNSFGYYTGMPIAANQVQLYSTATAAPVNTAFFILPSATTFGFYFNNGSTTFYSGTSAAGVDNRLGLFSRNGTGLLLNEYLIGIEDGPSNADFDYQDAIIYARVVPIPEPASIAGLAGAVLATVLLVRRRKA